MCIWISEYSMRLFQIYRYFVYSNYSRYQIRYENSQQKILSTYLVRGGGGDVWLWVSCTQGYNSPVLFWALPWTVDWSPVNLERALVRDAYLRPTGEIRGAVFCGCSLWSDLRAFSPTCWRWALCESLGAEKIREAPFWKVVSSSRHCPNSSPPPLSNGHHSLFFKKYAPNIQLNGPLFKKGLP